MYDYKFINARIVDGTGNPWFRGEIGVKDGKIVSVSKNLEGESLHVIDAEHQIVCPGFIDVHTHDDLAVISNPDHEPKLFQGVTSEVLANCGFGCAPVNKLTRKQLLQYISPVLGTYSREWGWKSFKEYVSVLSERSTSMNLVSQVAHGAVRIAVMGFESRPATSQEIEEMKALVEEAMQAGAIGLSLGLLYAPGCYADRAELIALSKVAARYGGILNCHMRAEGDSLLESMNEVFDIAEAAEIPLHISHLKLIGVNNWGKIHHALEMIESKKAQGLDVTCDIYTYTAGSSTLMSVLPSWVSEGGVEKALMRLSDPKQRAKIKNDMGRSVKGWDNFVEMLGWDRVVVSAVNGEANTNKAIEGMNFLEIAEHRKQEPVECLMDLLLEEQGCVTMILHQMSEEDVKAVLRSDYSMIGSDGLPLSSEKIHPRHFGTFPRLLSKYVRDEKVMPLQQAIRKMTSFSAQRFGFKRRGIVQEGYFADLVVFNEQEIRDRATFEKPRQYPDGIKYVMVNGRLVARHNHKTAERPGVFVPLQYKCC
ncbi:amidohydrolase family protein [Paenibacillus sp. tmac-D7]|uniref:N-acyl-D-amino-acid deacylase family protein n=1 Tax=Paenibacillus sp. tmac-D7 TaxID=2591462 RepID=UPI0015E876BD|nr:D-aminoacylase [Paenibacillus sp. tmac-D7]